MRNKCNTKMSKLTVIHTIRFSEKQAETLQKLKDYDQEVIKAKEKFELESAEFKKLSLLERMSMTDQGKNPRSSTWTICRTCSGKE